MSDNDNNKDNVNDVVENNSIEEIVDEISDTKNTGDNISNLSYEELSKKYTELLHNMNELKDKYIRMLAEYQNYQRRNEDEKKHLYKYGHINLMKELLRILDNLQKAFSDIDIKVLNDDRLKGIFYIKKDFENILKSYGLSVIETYGNKFDPQYHDAVITSAGPKDIIIKEIEPGYLLYDKVIRPSKVIVGNGDDVEDEERQKKLLEIADKELNDL